MRIRVHTEKQEAYSPDVEIDHDGTVVAARDLGKGEIIAVPMHMMDQILRQSRNKR